MRKKYKKAEREEQSKFNYLIVYFLLVEFKTIF